MSSEQDIKKIIKRRTILKGTLTRIEKFVQEFTVYDGDIDLLQIKQENFLKLCEEYDEIQTTLESKSEENDDDRILMEERLDILKSKFRKIIAPKQISVAQCSDSSNSVNSDVHANNSFLPKIELNKFNGKFQEWLAFSELFKSLIINNSSLNDTQRLHYLRSSVTGTAELLIKDVPFAPENFKVSWDLLVRRFEQKRAIAATHASEILNLQPLKKENHEDLSKFIDKLTSNVNSLKALKTKVHFAEIILMQYLSKNLDSYTIKLWESMNNNEEFPDLDAFIDFLEKRRQILQNSNAVTSSQNSNLFQSNSSTPFKRTNNFQKSFSATANVNNCLFCKQNHNLYKCTNFLKQNASSKFKFVKEHKLCFNCLRDIHLSKDCPSSSKCKVCSKPHHTLLHRNSTGQPPNDAPHTNQVISYCGLKSQCSPKVMLATAIVTVKDRYNKRYYARALLDAGSQLSFVSEQLAQRLNLKRQHDRLEVTGISCNKSTVKHSITINMGSQVSDFSTQIKCFILPSITSEVPSTSISVENWNIPEDLALADKHFNIPGTIDILLGAEIFLDLLIEGKISLGSDLPVLHNTHLGWIIAGKTTDKMCNSAKSLFVNTVNVQDQLEAFWKIEEVNYPTYSKDERTCMNHFQQNTTRHDSGRFIVRLPKKERYTPLGESRETAKNRLLILERRFEKNQNLKKDYVNFMKEYEQLGHMQVIPEDKIISIDEEGNKPYYLPHHAVFKDSTSTRTRVVFDASSKTDSDVSLNDILLVGPTIQEDIISIVLRFRTHIYAITADITKMFRQINVDHRDRNLQRILWRESPQDKIKHYQLNTVTYGTAPASFLSTRCLHQLADEHSMSHPHASEVIKRDFYMDDLQSGGNNLPQVKQLQEDIISILQRGGFVLHKWCSNNEKLLEMIPEEKRETKLPFKFDGSQDIHTLGLIWEPSKDVFKFEINVKPNISKFTKRSVLSTIASIYDPIGILGPVIMLCKCFMQQLWHLKISWNDELQSQLRSAWINIYDQLLQLKEITIPRYVMGHVNITNIEIHGFSDASETGYGACLYVRTTDDRGNISSQLLCSKSRVAPLKQLTIPRLELCGALLLARLVHKVIPILHMKISNVTLWTDSTIVLYWISAAPTKWKTFIANRVSEIQDMTENYIWKHVQSECNPCDVLSRGILPEGLQQHSLWWHGPAWLMNKESDWPQQPFISTCDDESKQQVIALHVNDLQSETISKFSSFTKAVRVMSYVLRFINNATNPKCKVTTVLTAKELENARIICIRQSQNLYFKEEISSLKNKRSINKGSPILSLHPFLDAMQCLRVGGRLNHADIPYDAKHQLILPRKAHITNLLIDYEHKRLMHAGPQLVHSSLRQHFWIVNAKNVIRQILHQCVTCYRLNATGSKQLMGQLPKDRVNITRPFYNCGVDYAGPFSVKQSSRTKVVTKCYIALFICMSTKAVHLELVSSLTSEAFIVALKRFSARRGLSANIYCDNGTNFVGANNILKELSNFLRENKNRDDITSYAANQGIQFHFIPARSPTFGGLWEAGVKSVKYHIRRIMGNMILTFYELETILIQVEGILNSRPICAISNHPDDPQALTIGHFLIGAPIMSPPDINYTDIPSNRLSRWQIIQQCIQRLWGLWYKDYLHQFQQRTRWTTRGSGIQPGMVVLLKEDHLPVMQWKMGVVEEVFPGEDGIVRVVSVRNNKNVCKRSIQKICVLPFNNSEVLNDPKDKCDGEVVTKYHH